MTGGGVTTFAANASHRRVRAALARASCWTALSTTHSPHAWRIAKVAGDGGGLRLRERELEWSCPSQPAVRRHHAKLRRARWLRHARMDASMRSERGPLWGPTSTRRRHQLPSYGGRLAQPAATVWSAARTATYACVAALRCRLLAVLGCARAACVVIPKLQLLVHAEGGCSSRKPRARRPRPQSQPLPASEAYAADSARSVLIIQLLL